MIALSRLASVMLLIAGAAFLDIGVPASLAADKAEIFVQMGHTDQITAVAFSADGKYLVSGSYDRTIKLWDIGQRREIRTFHGHSDSLLAVGFSADGSRLLSASADGIRVWDASSGREIRRFAGGRLKRLNSAVFSSDGKYALSSDGAEITLWDVATGRAIKATRSIGAETLSLSADRSSFLAGNSLSSSFKLWDMATGKEARVFKGHTEQKSPSLARFGGWNPMPIPGAAKSLAFSPDGKYALSGSVDKTAKLWDIATGRELRSVPHAATVDAVAFSPDGRLAATASEQSRDVQAALKLWEVQSGRELLSATPLNGTFGCVAFSRDGRYLAAGDHKILRIWDTASGSEIDWQFWYALPVEATLFSVDGRQIVSGSGTAQNGVFSLWDLSAGSKLLTVTGPAPVALSPDGKHLLTGMALVNVPEGTLEHTLAGHSYTALELDDSSLQQKPVARPMDALAAAFSSDGKTLYSWGADRATILGLVDGEYLKAWDVKGGQALAHFRGMRQMQGVTAVVFSADGRYALSAGGAFPNPLTLWDVSSGREIRSFGGEIKHYRRVALSANMKYALSWDNLNDLDGPPSLHLWDLESGKELRVLRGHSSAIESATFSSDGRYLLSGSLDRSVKLWDTASGSELRTFTGHAGFVTGVAFSPDSRQALSAGDATTRLWDVHTGKEVATFISFIDGEWIVITPEGYYNSSPNGHKYLNIRLGRQVYGIDQFYDLFYRPDIVATKLRGEEIGGLITLTMDEAIKHPPPRVAFTAVPQENEAAQAQVCYQVVSTGGGIGEVRLFQNGKLIRSDGYYRDSLAKSGYVDKQKLAGMNSRAIQSDLRGLAAREKTSAFRVESRPKGQTFEECVGIETVPGDNEISVTAFNAQNSVQSPLQTASFRSTRPAEEPHLYILSVGIDQYRDPSVNLKYAAKDARDILAGLPAKAASIYRPGNIHVTSLINSQASKAGILSAIADLSRQIRQGDAFIFFNASHGVLLQNQYYIVTADFDGSLANANALISSNEIVEISKRIRSLSQLFIFDTCHAGGIDNIVSGLYDARMSVMAKKTGLHIFASAGSVQSALDGYQGNGLYTYTLLQGIRNGKEVDKDKSGKVTVKSLGLYSRERTSEISRRLGHPQTPLIINYGRDSALFAVPQFGSLEK